MGDQIVVHDSRLFRYGDDVLHNRDRYVKCPHGTRVDAFALLC
jgi:hypothetical protein